MSKDYRVQVYKLIYEDVLQFDTPDAARFYGADKRRQIANENGIFDTLPMIENYFFDTEEVEYDDEV